MSWLLRGVVAVSSLVLAALTFGLRPASALPAIDFEGLANGEVVTDQLLATHGVVIRAINYNRSFDLAVVFDTSVASTEDPDLNGPPWSGGNISSENLGKVLILSEIDESGGFALPPDDEGQRPAGELIFDFETPFTSVGFDHVDIDDASLEYGSIEVLKEGVSIGSVSWEDFIDPLSPFYDPTVAYGNGSANRVSPISVASLGGTDADQLIFHVGGSYGLDNIRVDSGPVEGIPEPGAAFLFGLGIALAFARVRAAGG